MKIYQTIIISFAAFLVISCSSMQQPQGTNPTDILKSLNEASKTKDVEAIKRSVSKGTLALIEESAKAQNSTVDEMLRKDNGAPFKELPEMRNEKIEGDTATIELKNMTTDDWETVPFVKEDGAWRLALDKYLEESRRKAAEMMKTPPVEGNSDSNEAAPAENKQPKEAANAPAKPKK